MKQNPLPALAFIGLLVIIASTIHGGGPGFVMGLWAAAFLVCGLIPIITGYWLFSLGSCFYWFLGFVAFMVYMGGWHKDFGEGMWETLRWYFAWWDWLWADHSAALPRWL